MIKVPVARIGDMHVCPMHGPNLIVEGSPNEKANLQPIARVGDMTACGAKITIGAPGNSFSGDDVAFLGSLTDHGGVITTGSPDVFVGVASIPTVPVPGAPPAEPVPTESEDGSTAR